MLQTCVVAAAVLDVQLSDQDVTPLATVLVALGVPIVFQSARSVAPELTVMVFDGNPTNGVPKNDSVTHCHHPIQILTKPRSRYRRDGAL